MSGIGACRATLASSISRVLDEERRQRVAGRRRGAEVAADRAAVADLRRADGSRRLRERRQRRPSSRIASVYVSDAARRSVPFSRRQPFSSATSFRFSSASGRRRSKLSSTMTSVPPSIGSASGRSALSLAPRRAMRGLSTSTREAYSGPRERIGCDALSSPDASRSPAATSPPTSSCAAAGCSRSSRASGSTSTSRSRTAGSRGSATYDGERDRGRGRQVRRSGLHRRAHAPRVVEAPAVTSSRASCSRSGRRPSSRIRTRSRTCSAPTACTGCSTRRPAFRSTSTSWRRRACPRRATSRRGARSAREISRRCCAGAACSASRR